MDLLLRGAADLIVPLAPEHGPRVTSGPSTQIAGVLYAGLYVLAVNVWVPPLNNPMIRQALSLAIDRETIVWRGRGVVPNGPIPRGDRRRPRLFVTGGEPRLELLQAVEEADLDPHEGKVSGVHFPAEASMAGTRIRTGTPMSRETRTATSGCNWRSPRSTRDSMFSEIPRRSAASASLIPFAIRHARSFVSSCDIQRRDPLDVALAARGKWGRSLTEERDRRVAAEAQADATPRTMQALRGHVTRALLADLEPVVRLAKESRRRKP